jgi:hypothetical protein
VGVRFGVTVVNVVCVLLWKYGTGARVGLVFSFVCEVLFQYEEHENCVQRFVISCGLLSTGLQVVPSPMVYS